MRPVPERHAAKAAGERFYETGKPCRNGHLCERRTSTGNCVQCDREKGRRHYRRGGTKHPARLAALAAGLPRYSTGAPCQRGHSSERWAHDGRCIACSAAARRRWLDRNPGWEAANVRARRAADPAPHRAAQKRYAQKNPQAVRELLRRWKANNPERAAELARVGANNRRARKAQNGGRFTAKDIDLLYERQNGTCAACPSSESLEIDHILPVVLGGTSDPSNLQLLCLPCNRSKGKKHPDEWRGR